jgi:putative transposase
MNTLMKYGSSPRKVHQSPLYYFVTLCTRSGAPYFGQIRDNKMNLIAAGKIAEMILSMVPSVFDEDFVVQSVIMPNHMHLLLAAGGSSTSVEKKIRGLKSVIKILVNMCGQDFHWKATHQCYPLADVKDLERFKWYTLKNASVWKSDSLNREKPLIL